MVRLPPRRHSRKWRWIGGITLFILAVVGICIRIVIDRAEPILRTRVIETLTTRFKSHVELKEIHVWMANGLHVEGRGLQIYGASDPNLSEPGVQPLLAIDEFGFQTGLRNLFREPMRVDTVNVRGLVMNIPPHSERQEMRNLRRRTGKMSIAVTQFVCVDTKVIVNTSRPGKAPFELDISELRMRDIGPGQPFQFDAMLTNPKPEGAIQSTGQFGPINERSPKDSAVAGTYTFTHADLGTLKGLSGILSSTGQYGGTLGRIEVEGETDTPDFRLAVSGHAVPLHTDFHAIVDGTDGDTYLQPVRAHWLHSSLIASGKVVRMANPHGHNIELDVDVKRARIQDLLQLGIRTDPPVMTGSVSMHTKLHLPPGSEDVSNRLQLAGKFQIFDGFFSSEKIQNKVDSLSLRSQGKPRLAKLQDQPAVPSNLSGDFTLSNGALSFSTLDFQVPGTRAQMTGRYTLDGNVFDFHGMLRLDAKLSQMTTGWKSILLKPVDPFFHKDGAGTELPFKITGTKEEPKFGLDFHHHETAAGHNEAKSTR